MAQKEERKRVADEERRKYLELNNLNLEECNDQDLENIRFNVAYALANS